MSNGNASTVERRLFGVEFSKDTLSDLLEQVVELPTPGQGVRLIVTANLDHIVLLRKNGDLRSAYENAWKRTIDGAPVFAYSKIRKAGVAERITGADLLPKLLGKFRPGKQRPFFVVPDGAVQGGLERWARSVGFRSGEVEYVIPPFGFEKDDSYGDFLARRISSHRTTHLIFGVGCPRSEVWISNNSARLGDLYAFAVGAALGFFTGTAVRAPYLFRVIGFEWLWRVKEEPKRLGQRYFINSWSFLAALRDDILGR